MARRATTTRGHRRAVAALALAASLLTAVHGPPAGADSNEAPGSPAVAAAVSAGGAHTCAIGPQGHLSCWGDNTHGQLGLGDTADRGVDPDEMGDALPVVDVGTGRTVTEVTAGDTHTCAILDDGTVKCWGANGVGQLGLGDTDARGDGPGEMGDALPPVDLGTGHTAVAITAGLSHTCAILDDGTVKCWGANGVGRLGLGDTADRGDHPGEMGDALPPIDLGAGHTATAISAGSYQTCAILDDHTLRCWGSGLHGQLGLGDTADRGDHPGEMGDALPPVGLGAGRTATAISAGRLFTCALLDDGGLKCWGVNEQGQLGQGDLTNRGDEPNEMGDDLPSVDLGAGRTATAVTTGSYHACALLDDATVRCWGDNGSGELGQGDDDRRTRPPVAAVALDGPATMVTAGADSTCAVIDDVALKCWGLNVEGQLGRGDVVQAVGDDAGEMGAALVAVDVGNPEGARLSVSADVGGPAVAGSTVPLSVTVTNRGVTALTGVHVVEPDVACTPSLPDLPVGAAAATDCAVPLPVEPGPFIVQVHVGSDQTEPVGSPELPVSVDPAHPRVDAEIRRHGQATWVGEDIVNDDGTGQRRVTPTRRGHTSKFFVRITNEHAEGEADTLVVNGPRAGSLYRVRYVVGRTDVTAEVVAGTFAFDDVPAGGARVLKVKITPLTAAVGRVKLVAVTITSAGDPDTGDTVVPGVLVTR